MICENTAYNDIKDIETSTAIGISLPRRTVNYTV